MAATQSERSSKYKSIGSGAGLIRVEVLVAPEDRETILAQAAYLRRQRRAENTRNGTLRALIDEAIAKHKGRALWNVPLDLPDTKEQAAAVAAGLRHYGGVDGFKLAGRIEDLLREIERC
jgi:hypothetical protein